MKESKQDLKKVVMNCGLFALSESELKVALAKCLMLLWTI